MHHKIHALLTNHQRELEKAMQKRKHNGHKRTGGLLRLRRVAAIVVFAYLIKAGTIAREVPAVRRKKMRRVGEQLSNPHVREA
ncbi:MAG TPA: hypothetical protein VKL99_08715 [Candidatus Angelobacter sp.]|nr:hypothetical protein [Candidatus Angelobacter sp.]